ncbi:hypothetical protein EYR40_001127 [Pleurotus pulmonarius]|nr:hypothetical protein EYR40_001127 [Pleurotus pulmonarius]
MANRNASAIPDSQSFGGLDSKFLTALMKQIPKNPVTGKVEMPDIMKQLYMSTHPEEMEKLLTQADAAKIGDTNVDLAGFDYASLGRTIAHESFWVIQIENMGFVDATGKPLDAEAARTTPGATPTFIIYCYDDGESHRFMQDVDGLPTTETILQLKQHADGLRPFLDSLPKPFHWRVETAEEAKNLHDGVDKLNQRGVKVSLNLAEKDKTAGNSAFQKKDRVAAIQFYSDAIGHLLDALSQKPMPSDEAKANKLMSVCFANRAATYLLPGDGIDLKKALADGESAEKADPDYGKAYARQATACKQLGDLEKAKDVVARAISRPALSMDEGLGLITCGQKTRVIKTFGGFSAQLNLRSSRPESVRLHSRTYLYRREKSKQCGHFLCKMKFNDGFWLLKNGVKPFFGLQVTRVLEEPDGYTLHVSTRPIRHRGDTLGGPVLTVKVHSPTEGVVGVNIEHFANEDAYPSIPLFPDAKPMPAVSLSKSDSSYSLSTGGLTAEITENPYTITFKSPQRTLTSAGYKHQGIYDVPARWTTLSASNSSCLAMDTSSNPAPAPLPPTVRYIHSELNLSPGELVYGFGEQFGAFVKNGQSIKIWNQDGGTSSDQAYKCVPFYITNRNYGVFINHPGEVEVEVGSEKVSRVGVSVADKSLEYFIIYGETPLEILDKYTRITGRPACSFTFDPDNFPDPKAYLSEIKEKYGVKICVWINPYISQLSPIFKEGAKEGYFIKRTDGSVWQWDLWQPGLAILDITNPAACKWYTDKLSALIDLGVDAFKTDFGERIPHASVKFHDGSDPIRMHNSFAVQYNQLVFDLLKTRLGESQAVLFARSSAAGGQRFPVHWGGDCESTFEAMAETIRGCLSITASGFAFSSHDIGGFEGHPPPEIYQRWVAFGVFSSHTRLHGSSSYRVPWIYGEEAAANMSKWLDTKHRLMPYIYQLAVQANQNGHPIMRAMFLQFPEDPTTHHLDRQYMFGPSLLVAPVFVPLGEMSVYYLPGGKWTSFFHPERVVQGPVWIEEHVPIGDIPVWVRQGSVLCLGPAGIGRPDYSFTENVHLQAYELEEGQSVHVEIPSEEGAGVQATISVIKSGDEVKAELSGAGSFATLEVYADGSSHIQTLSGAKEGSVSLA